MAANFIQTAFSAGEITPSLFGQVSLAKLHVAATTLRNCYVSYRGGANSRAGTALVARAKQPYAPSYIPPRIIRFQYNINQGYCLELGDYYMRFHYLGSPVIEAGLNITGATQANPCVLTVTNTYTNGDWVYITGVNGMTQLNGNTYIVTSASGSNVTLTDLNGNAINATAYGAYSSGGTTARVYTISTPWLASDLPLLKYTESADVVSFAHPNYPPYDLTRVSATNWVLSQVSFGAAIQAPASTDGYATTLPSQATSPATLPAGLAYCVTAVSSTGEESVASPVVNITNGVDPAQTAGSEVIGWTPISGASYYNIYKAPTSYNTQPGNTTNALPVPAGAIFGYVGSSYGTTFVDSNITADSARVPPLHNNPFAPGQIVGINVSSAGSNLTSVSLSITTGTGSGFVGTPVVVGGTLVSVIVVNPGKNYVPTDSISFGGTGAYATGSITFGSNPAASSTVTMNGVVWTFVTGAPSGNQTQIQSSLAQTLATLAYNLGSSSNTSISVAAYGANLTQLLITYNTAGTGGNSYTLAASAATPSGSTLSGGGSGTAPTGTLNVGPETGTYPGCVAYFQERRVYASSINQPDTYWMSKPAAFLNFDSGIPVQDTDAITGTPWTQQVNGIQFMIERPGGLLTFTGAGAWQVGGAGSSAINPVPITPSSQQAQSQSFTGCSPIVQPLTIGNDIVFVQSKGSIVSDIAYQYFQSIYLRNDLTILSGQLFTGYTLLQSAWCEDPYKLAWFARNDGTLLSLTYLKEQEVYGWARHDTQGAFLSCCSVTELPVDALYLVSSRNIEGNTNIAYFIERMNNRNWTSVETCWCVDCAASYPQPTPNATLFVSGTAGTVTAVASVGVFSPGSVGSVIRSGGGIATITSYVSSTQVTAVVNFPITAMLPNTTQVLPQLPGSWTLTVPTTTVSGLTHLIGQTVTGLADGVVIPPQVVSAAGTITLSFPASAIVVGLGFTAQVQTPYIETGESPTIQDRRKTITAVAARVEASAKLQSGTNQPDGSVQVPPQLAPTWSGMLAIPDQGATYTSPGGATVQNLFTGDMRINLTSDWETPGQVAVQQVNPLPMNITALIPEILEGDLPAAGYTQEAAPRDNRQPARGPGMWMLR